MQPAILSSKMYKNCFSGSRLCSAQPRNQWASLTSRKVQDRRTHVVSRATAKELVSETDSRPQEVSRIWQHFAAKASGGQAKSAGVTKHLPPDTAAGAVCSALQQCKTYALKQVINTRRAPCGSVFNWDLLLLPGSTSVDTLSHEPHCLQVPSCDNVECTTNVLFA